MKTILVILDGLADRAQEELEGLTPLEAAHTPHLDYLCNRAETGIMVPYRQGIPLGTETAHFILFGYDLEDFPGRGAIEALGEGAVLREGEVFLRTTFGFVEKEEGFLVKSRDTRELSQEEAKILARAFPPSIKGINIKWKHSFDVHGILTLQGKNLSSFISDSDPFAKNKHIMKIEAFDTKDKRAVFTAGVLNQFLLQSHEALTKDPVNLERKKEGKMLANFLLTKWAGYKKDLPTFQEKHGMTSLMIGASGLLKGVARFLGMDFKYCKDFKKAVQLALESPYDFIHVHTKEPDEAAHTKNPRNKVEVIEKLDEELKPLRDKKESLKEEVLLIITADHSTPSSGTLIHSGEQVPIMFMGKGVRVDEVESFGERSCTKGSIRMYGPDLMPMILNLTDRALLYGLRQGGKRLNHVPEGVKRLLPM